VPVGSGGEEIAAYWTRNPANDTATQAYIMIHGKLRDGDGYWSTMNSILASAVKDDYPGVDENAIVIAPQFFSTLLNQGQYGESELAWDDTNAWQAGDPANHPAGTTLTSIDALDALIDVFADASRYPAMRNVTVVGHGGGGQLGQRYASVAKPPPSNVHVRYIHGDPSSCAYFTEDRPVTDISIASKVTCPTYNDWRYGFKGFAGTSVGLKTPREYFQQYISRDVVSVVGYQDTDAGGDQYCMALLQGGEARRDRNLSWWKYINMLAKTNEDLTGFPGNFSALPDWSDLSGGIIGTRLVVIEDADHDAEEVFSSAEGRAALFDTGSLPVGWRPSGWRQRPARKLKSPATATNSSSAAGARSTTAGASGGASSGAAKLPAVGVASLLALPFLGMLLL
jgi:pimeloyl-ACP methyl ester carboxylesterase